MNSTLLFILLGLLAGGAGGFFFASTKFKKESEDANKKATKIISDAEQHARDVEKRVHENEKRALAMAEDSRKEAAKNHEKAEKIIAEARADEKEIKQKLEISEKRLVEKEGNLDKKMENLEQKKTDLAGKEEEIEKIKTEAETIREEEKKKLEEVAKLSKEEAKQLLLIKVEKDSEEELVKKIQEGEAKAKLEADKKANKIIAQAIQRLSQEATSESTVTLVTLPDDGLKGRIIGREGRNITAFEMATGVDVIVDDTPGAVLISGFDLLRRYVAKTSLEKLIADGRIHPARIEEVVKKTEADAQKLMQEWGEQLVVETGVISLPPNLMKLIGRLRFRTSYGQNVLKHSAEAAWLGAAIASELGADVKTVKTACLLHDIGKAVDHEIEGPHATIGANILRKFKMSDEIVHAVEAHHEDVPIESMTDIIVQVADAISASRPGARRESLDAYIKRLEELENISKGFTGVSNAYAIQAGREVRVIVKPDEIDDLAAHKLAKNISSKIESEMTYPGQIKVNVIRETRAEELAK